MPPDPNRAPSAPPHPSARRSHPTAVVRLASPRARVRLLEAAALQAALHALPAATTPVIALYVRSTLAAPPTVHQQPMPEDAAAAAQELFAVLRHLDAQGVQEIWIETPPDSAAWDGVRDRLQRAAASV